MLEMMEIGDLVRVRKSQEVFSGKVGIIVDQVENQSGFLMCEVLIEGYPHWFNDIDLQVVNEDR